MRSTFHSVRASRNKFGARLLASTALLAAFAAQQAVAQVVTKNLVTYDLPGYSPEPFTNITMNHAANVLVQIYDAYDPAQFIILNTKDGGTQTIQLAAGSTYDTTGYANGVYGLNSLQTTVSLNGAFTGSGNVLNLSTVGTGGAIAISGAGSVTSTASSSSTGGAGILLASDTGAISVTGLDAGVTGQTFGVSTATTTGATSLNLAGAVTASAGTAIASTSTSGDIAQAVAGAVTATGGAGLSATTAGNIAQSASGAVNASTYGFYAVSSSGNVSVSAGGAIVGGTGVYAATGGAGNVSVTTSGTVTPGASVYGILTDTTAGSGATTINVLGGATPSAGSIGVEANSGSGNATITVGPHGVITGGAAGLVVNAGSGLSTVNNYGAITTSSPGGASYAFSAGAGTGGAILNNYGSVTGLVASSGAAFVFNNGGAFTAAAGSHALNAASNTINNYGVLTVAAGLGSGSTATLAGAVQLNDMRGGVIDLSVNPQSTPNTLKVQNLAIASGGVVKVDFNAAGASSSGQGYDSSSSGRGTTGTIDVTGKLTTAPGAKIAIVSTNAMSASMTGSAAIVYTGVKLNAPQPTATLTQSSNYTLVGDPSNGRSIFALVDDGNGGVYLQWKPNLSVASLGGYMGGAPGASSTAATTIAIGAAGLAGLGGGSGGATTGVAGKIADAAASGAGVLRPSMADCSANDGWSAWGQIDASGASFSAGGVGRSYAGSIGVERDLSRAFSADCGRLAVGAFAVDGDSSFNYPTGTVEVRSAGGGGFIRASSETGVYGSLMGASTGSDSDIVNAAYASSAKSSALNGIGLADMGYAFHFAELAWLDTRAFGSYGRSASSAFTDTWGIPVSNLSHAMTSYGVTESINYAFDRGSAVYLRSGVTTVQDAQSIAAFGVEHSGAARATYKIVEGGFWRAYGPSLIIAVSGYGTFSGTSIGYGGLGRLALNY